MMTTLADLSPALYQQLGAYQIDWLIEKHERWAWKYHLPKAELLELGGYLVLLPVPAAHHRNISLERLFVDPSGDALTLYLRDTTTWDELQANPATRQDERWRDDDTCFLAVCTRVREQPFFFATVYHECVFQMEPRTAG